MKTRTSTPLPASLLALAACLAFALATAAQTVPALVNYQGRLANPDGSPLPTADYELSFRVWDAAANGALVWGPQLCGGQSDHAPQMRAVARQSAENDL